MMATIPVFMAVSEIIFLGTQKLTARLSAGAFNWNCRSSGADEPLVEPQRSSDRQDGRPRSDRRVDQLVARFGAHAQGEASAFESHELGAQMLAGGVFLATDGGALWANFEASIRRPCRAARGSRCST